MSVNGFPSIVLNVTTDLHGICCRSESRDVRTIIKHKILLLPVISIKPILISLFGPTSKASELQSINIYTMKLFNIFAVTLPLVMASGGLASAIPSPHDEIIVETIVHDNGPTAHSSRLQKSNANHQVITNDDHRSSADETEEVIKDPAQEKDVGGKHNLSRFQFPEVILFPSTFLPLSPSDQDSRPVLM